MPVLRQAPYDRARQVFKALAQEGWLLQHPERFDQYGPGMCQGSIMLEGFDRAEPPTGKTTPFADVQAFFLEAATRTSAPNPRGVARTMARIIFHGTREGFQADPARISREWDGDLMARHQTDVLPRMTDDQTAFDDGIFWRQAAQFAAEWYAGGQVNPQITWVCVRYMLAELVGVSPNPFEEYLTASSLAP